MSQPSSAPLLHSPPTFRKVPGESAWVNVAHISAFMVRPQMSPAASGLSSLGSLEGRHESTGRFEVTVLVAGQLLTVREAATRGEGEAFILALIQSGE